MTTYYYGSVEFGDFVIGEDSYPLAIINQVKEVKDFEQPAQAWQYYTEHGDEFESYIGLDAVDENDVQYEIVFKQHK